MIERNPVFYKKTLFRSILHLNEDLLSDITPFSQEYIDYSIMLQEHLLLILAPFQKE